MSSGPEKSVDENSAENVLAGSVMHSPTSPKSSNNSNSPACCRRRARARDGIGGMVVAGANRSVDVLAYDQWAGTRALLELLTTFSFPNNRSDRSSCLPGGRVSSEVGQRVADEWVSSYSSTR